MRFIFFLLGFGFYTKTERRLHEVERRLTKAEKTLEKFKKSLR